MREVRGNALFLVLIAVALFAALSYAVTKSGRGSGGNLGREQAELTAAQVLQNASVVQLEVSRQILAGTPVDKIHFSALTCADGQPEDANCCTELGASSNECTSGEGCIFAKEDGGIQFPSLPAAIAGPNALVSTQQCYYPVQMNYSFVGTAAPDIFLSIDDIDGEVCAAINRKVGVAGVPNEYDWTGMPFGCYRGSWGGGFNFFIYALAER